MDGVAAKYLGHLFTARDRNSDRDGSSDRDGNGNRDGSSDRDGNSGWPGGPEQQPAWRPEQRPAR
ncbi:hypothetical protein ACIBCB_25315 [Streptomyces uncialis]|uniref:hypothetical protein n=1 Tax=Streptomyces uncialis TaxID=1048205 RepID=UPI0037A76B51